MVCPMRFLLLGASAVVAVLAVVYTCQSSETAVDTTSGQSRKVTSDFLLLHCAIPSLRSLGVRQSQMFLLCYSNSQFHGEGRMNVLTCLCMYQEPAASWWQLLLDMLTGKYLWQKWQQWQKCEQQEGSKSCKKLHI